jgi:hypothetical protein
VRVIGRLNGSTEAGSKHHKIKVPFHKRTFHLGQEEFELYRHKLISVIRGKMLRSSYLPHLHTNFVDNHTKFPSELGFMANSTRQRRSLMRIVTFKIHVREPGCLLLEIIVGLLFASECTRLLAFGDAKLMETWDIDRGGLGKERTIPREYVADRDAGNHQLSK